MKQILLRKSLAVAESSRLSNSIRAAFLLEINNALIIFPKFPNRLQIWWTLIFLFSKPVTYRTFDFSPSSTNGSILDRRDCRFSLLTKRVETKDFEDKQRFGECSKFEISFKGFLKGSENFLWASGRWKLWEICSDSSRGFEEGWSPIMVLKRVCWRYFKGVSPNKVWSFVFKLSGISGKVEQRESGPPTTGLIEELWSKAKARVRDPAWNAESIKSLNSSLSWSSMSESFSSLGFFLGASLRSSSSFRMSSVASKSSWLFALEPRDFVREEFEWNYWDHYRGFPCSKLILIGLAIACFCWYSVVYFVHFLLYNLGPW